LTIDATKKSAAAAQSNYSGQQPDLAKAIGWTLVSVATFALTAWAGRECGKHMTAMNMVFYRNFISLIILLVAFRWLGISLASLWTERPWMQWGRALVHFAGQWSWMTALLLIPLIELISLEFTFPLWVALLAPLLLGEELTKPRVFAALMGFAGVIVIVLGPTVISGGKVAPSFSLGTAMALSCAVFFCFNMIGTRYLTRYDSALTILMFMVVNHSVMAFVLGYQTLRVPQGTLWLWVIMLGVCSLIAHFALAKALVYADTVVVAPLDFLRIPLMVTLGVVVYNETLQPIVLVGTLLVLAGNGVNIWQERKRKVARQPTPVMAVAQPK
jgi:drug/metabolite transporter (DMT)-like permease